MGETRTTEVRFPPGRYGRRREPSGRGTRWILGIGAAVVVVVGVAISVAMYEQYGESEYRHIVTGFDTAESSVTVTFEVFKPEGTAGTCLVRARAVDGAEVGHADVAIPADRGDTRVEYTLETSGEPVTGEVVRCYPAS